MITRESYQPGPAAGARIEKKDGDQWALIVVKHLRHAPEIVWDALTDPAQLREWAPFDASASLDAAGSTVQLTTVGAPQLNISETTVRRAERPTLLIYSWGGNDMRWELEPDGAGTRLTLWTSIDRRYIAMGAAGWHLCFDVLDLLLDGTPIGRMAGMPLMQDPRWQRLHAEYANEFGLATRGGTQ